ncbi:hypothetical protein Tco_0986416, partial [Tanacetum coccineum]
IFLKNQLKDVPVPMDHFPVPTLTKKVLAFMIKKGGSSKSAAKQQSTDKPDEGTGKPNVGTYKVKVSTNRQVEGTGEDKEQDPSESVTLIASTNTDWYDLDMDIDETMDYTLAQEKGSIDKVKVSTDRQVEGTGEDKEPDLSESVTPTAPTTTPTAPTITLTPTPIVIGDDETIAQVLITMSQNKVKQKEKEKGVELLDIERPRPTSTRSVLSLRPLPKIDPKAKGKGRIKEENESKTESEYITEVEKKFKQLANDEEIARKVQEEWEAEEEKKRLAEEEATMAAVTNKQKGENFIAIGSAEDERLIKEMNEKVVASSKKSVNKDDSVKEEIKEEESTRNIKLGIRKKMKSKKRKFRKDTSEGDNVDELRLCLTIASDEDKDVDSEILDKKYPIIEWNSECLGTKPQYDETKDLE